VCGAAGLSAGRGRREAREVGLGEEEGVEPVDAAFVAGGLSVGNICRGRGIRTLCGDSLGWRFASRPFRGCAGI
jgi:hypothetical protein